MVPAKSVLGTTPPDQLSCQSAQQMTGATSSASVVALLYPGYNATENDLGAQLYEVAPGSPAAAAGLRCNDVVVAVNNQPIHTSADLVSACPHAPGEAVRFTVNREGPAGQQQTTTLVARFGGAGRGPSAGLALTLAIIDALSSGDLTGRHAVAATGTIELDGAVGDVGGVAQKAVAVRRAGAKVFFVPAGQLKEAESQAGSLKIYPFNTLEQALDDLRALGGRVPLPTSFHHPR